MNDNKQLNALFYTVACSLSFFMGLFIFWAATIKSPDWVKIKYFKNDNCAYIVKNETLYKLTVAEIK